MQAGFAVDSVTNDGAPWRAPGPCGVLLHAGSQVAVSERAPLIANPAGVLLLHAGERVDGWNGRADRIGFDPGALAAAARLAGLDADRPFAQPWLRLRTEEFLHLRTLLRDGEPAGVGGWLAGLLRGAAAEWRKRPVPAARDFGQRGRFDLAQAMAGFLDQHWQRNVGLAELETVFGLSGFHLLRVFRRETGCTPHQYALQLRLRRSLLQMEQSAPRLGELAEQAGFSSHAHFSSAFRAAWGLSPREYAGQLPRARSPRL